MLAVIMENSEVRSHVLRELHSQEMQGVPLRIDPTGFANRIGAQRRQVEVALKNLVDMGWLDGEYVAGTDIPVIASITAAGVIAAEQSPQSEASEQAVLPRPNPKRVFVVHGRNTKLRDSLFAFLRAIGLEPIEWPQAIALTRKATPYVGEILEAAFNHAQAVWKSSSQTQKRRRLKKPYSSYSERKGC